MNALEQQLNELAEHLRSEVQNRLQSAVFGPKDWKLPRPRVCIMEAKRSVRIGGWYSAHRWKQGAVELDEIVLTPASVGKGLYEAASVILHELVHMANAIAKIKDTSREGRYHNARFKRTAELVGLVVKHDLSFGWCDTDLGSELKNQIKELVSGGTFNQHPFKYQRKSDDSAMPSLVKFKTACGTFVYVTRGRAHNASIFCGCCGQKLCPSSD